MPRSVHSTPFSRLSTCTQQGYTESRFRKTGVKNRKLYVMGVWRTYHSDSGWSGKALRRKESEKRCSLKTADDVHCLRIFN